MVGTGSCQICHKKSPLNCQFYCLFQRTHPHTLLTFGPNFYLHDLPCTSSDHALEAEAAAHAAGLDDVRIGNRHLLDLGWD